MPVVVKHKKVSEVPDSADEEIIQPSDWNDEHEISGAVSLEELNARLQDFSAENPADYNGVGFSYGMTSNGTAWNPGAFRVAKYTGTGIPLMNVLQMTDTGGRLSSGDPVNNFNTVNKRYLEQATPTYRGLLPETAHDLNDYREMGLWSQNKTVGARAGLNYPAMPLATAGFLEVMAGHPENIHTIQRYTSYPDGRSFVRMEGLVGVWSAWREELTQFGAQGLMGFTSQTYDLGNSSGRTIKPVVTNGNYQTMTNNGAFTLQAPDDISWQSYSMLIRISGTGGAMTATGFTKVNGVLRTTGNNFMTIRVLNTTKVLNIEEAS